MKSNTSAEAMFGSCFSFIPEGYCFFAASPDYDQPGTITGFGTMHQKSTLIIGLRCDTLIQCIEYHCYDNSPFG